jgi:hypothetical protein
VIFTDQETSVDQEIAGEARRLLEDPVDGVRKDLRPARKDKCAGAGGDKFLRRVAAATAGISRFAPASDKRSVQIAVGNVRFRGQSGHGAGIAECPLLTQSGQSRILANDSLQ